MAKDILNFIHNNDYYSQIVIHGFSVGGYLLGEVLVHVTRDMTKYQQTINRIACQIYDSAADITEIPVGVPKALFPRNPRLQLALKQYMLYHMKVYFINSEILETKIIIYCRLFMKQLLNIIFAVAKCFIPTCVMHRLCLLCLKQIPLELNNPILE